MKNKALRTAAVLLIAVLFTSSIISGTYAKFAMKGSNADEARVAKFGVEVYAEGKLFGEMYQKAPANTVTTTDDSITVKSMHYLDTDNVVAPGTKSDEGMRFGISGTPETDVKITIRTANQNLTLKTGEYGVLYALEDEVTVSNFEDKLDEYGTLYVKVESGNLVKYVEATKDNLSGNVYRMKHYVKNTGSNYRYTPMIFALRPNAGDGMTIDSTHAVIPPSSYSINCNDKNLDVICWGIWRRLYTADKAPALNNAAQWPSVNVQNKNRAERTFSIEVPAGTDIGEYLGLEDENVSWEWVYNRADFNGDTTKDFTNKDTILGDLMAEKTGDFDGIVVKKNYSSINTNNGMPTFVTPTEYVAPVEYVDYCLDSSFEVEITVTQMD